MNSKFFFRWISPLGFICGILFSLISSGNWQTGAIGFVILFVLGFWLLLKSWEWGGASNKLFIVILSTLVIRLLVGSVLYLILPVAGYQSDENKAGYIFTDAYRRDTQAYQLATSTAPIISAFNKKVYSDQYGGMLAFSAWIYRYLSADAHRPLMIVVVAAFFSALAIAFFWKSVEKLWGTSMAWVASLIAAFYPESVLQGATQMREPFLISFIFIGIWGFILWRSKIKYQSWLWLTIALLGLLLFSPVIALVLVIVFAGWVWFSGEHQLISWKNIIITLLIITAAAVLFLFGAYRDGKNNPANLGLLASWLHEVSRWGVLVLHRSSGWMQKLFETIPSHLILPFVTIYGITQPVLPAAIFDNSSIIAHVISIIRALGWYLLVPFLFYGFVSANQNEDKNQRALWIWIGSISWIWIVFSALRAGGDMWDNPRYRVIFIGLQALFAAQAFIHYRQFYNPWLKRILGMEITFLLFFSYWYIARHFALINLPFFVMLALIFGICALIYTAGLIIDRRRNIS